jgi:hypothetical protein
MELCLYGQIEPCQRSKQQKLAALAKEQSPELRSLSIEWRGYKTRRLNCKMVGTVWFLLDAPDLGADTQAPVATGGTTTMVKGMQQRITNEAGTVPLPPRLLYTLGWGRYTSFGYPSLLAQEVQQRRQQSAVRCTKMLSIRPPWTTIPSSLCSWQRQMEWLLFLMVLGRT